MVYVALLRGINVGGKRKVDMRRLKAVFEDAGMEDVLTYINSGNVVFSHRQRKPSQLAGTLEAAIEAEFGFEVDVLIRDLKRFQAVVDALPDDWANDKVMKCDVLFLQQAEDKPAVVDRLTIKPEIDDVRYLPGAIIWGVEDRKKVTRSGQMKLAGTPLYKQMTIRNCNTTRKLLALMLDR